MAMTNERLEDARGLAAYLRRYCEPGQPAIVEELIAEVERLQAIEMQSLCQCVSCRIGREEQKKDMQG